MGVEQEDVLRVDAVAAEGASGVGVEPRVDALDVEGVPALGEEAEDLGALEAVEADGALEAFLVVAAECAEAEHRERLHHSAVDAGVFSSGSGRVGG